MNGQQPPHGGHPQQGYGAPQGYQTPPGYPPQGGYAPQPGQGTRPPPVRINAAIYIIMILLGFLGAGILFFFASQPATKEALPAVPLPLILYMVFLGIFVFKMYKAINDGQSSPGPGLACVLVLIPFVSIVGMFVVWIKFPGQYNAFIQRHGIRAQPLGSGLYIATPILMLLFPLVGLILLLVTIGKTAGAVNALSAGALPPAQVHQR